jgi:ABC-type sugar transport system ATPase subunit
VLLLNPSAVLIVYPNNNADPMLQKEIFERIDAMLRTGMSVIIFSNNIQDTLSVCSRLVIFSKSRVVSYMKREEALSEDMPDLIARYS